ncbi:uncharacterized protein LOC132752414 isoform X2 [Ruditapes philippinarum]|uniref:uncharacterized protein LOC132752414 isoform X2 n=1 Tax=Ruditapes philippinarum TaxID=129788 RepID=UPI00295B2C43|nr:uncharacterized protein LOC132752414 isoform X2 [Ruditapes philippinarum]
MEVLFKRDFEGTGKKPYPLNPIWARFSLYYFTHYMSLSLHRPYVHSSFGLVPSECPTLVCRGLRPLNAAFALLILILVFYLMKRDPGEGATQEIGQTEALEDLERRFPWPWSHEVGGFIDKIKVFIGGECGELFLNTIHNHNKRNKNKKLIQI